MRIDRSDLADGAGSAHMTGRVRLAPDDRNAAGKDQGKGVSGDGPRLASRRSGFSLPYRTDRGLPRCRICFQHGLLDRKPCEVCDGEENPRNPRAC